MGIQVWHARGTAVDAVELAPTPAEASPAAPAAVQRPAADTQPEHPAPTRQGGLNDQQNSGPAESGQNQDRADVSVDAATQATADATQTLAFSWMKTESCLLIYSETDSMNPDKVKQQLLKDLVLAMDWHCRGPSDGRANVTLGEFRWPQLLQSTGTPQRAIAVWLDKYAVDNLSWFAADDQCHVEVRQWMGSMADRLINIGDLNSLDAEAKRTLWQQLKSSR